MTVVQINATSKSGSTGQICAAVSRLLTAEGIENYILSPEAGDEKTVISPKKGPLYYKIQALGSRLFGNFGFNSRAATREMLATLDRLRPDIVHLHNLHSHNCHLGMLLSYLKEKRIKTFWTFHDCWAFTGYCTYFTAAHCDRYKGECHRCPQRRSYSWLFDRSTALFRRKRQALAGLDLTVITPSRWLADVVKGSFLGACPVRVIHNGIDLSTFSPTESDLRARLGVADKILLLGVAYDWREPRKGLDVFCELAARLDDRYRILLVGADGQTAANLPKGIIALPRTKNAGELAALYTAADLFVNPTREDNFPTVNIEALACGTPVLTFDTGGSAEIPDATSGASVPCDDIDALLGEIRRITEERPYSPSACRARAAAYARDEKYREYLALYQDENQ